MAFPAENVLLQLLPQVQQGYLLQGDTRTAEYAARYFLSWQLALHGNAFASRKSKTSPRLNHILLRNELADSTSSLTTPTLINIFESQQFRGISPQAVMSLTKWLQGEWPLQYCENIPTPLQVLALQCEGKRPVTIISDYPRMLQPVLEKQHGFEFMLHDLEHAWHLYHDAEHFTLQVSFARHLQQAIQAGLYDRFMQDAEFVERFDYLISDMNTHPIHGLHYLHAIVVEWYLRQEERQQHEMLSMQARSDIDALLQALADIWCFSGNATQALLNLRQGRLQDADARCITDELHHGADTVSTVGYVQQEATCADLS